MAISTIIWDDQPLVLSCRRPPGTDRRPPRRADHLQAAGPAATVRPDRRGAPAQRHASRMEYRNQELPRWPTIWNAPEPQESRALAGEHGATSYASSPRRRRGAMSARWSRASARGLGRRTRHQRRRGDPRHPERQTGSTRPWPTRACSWAPRPMAATLEQAWPPGLRRPLLSRARDRSAVLGPGPAGTFWTAIWPRYERTAPAQLAGRSGSPGTGASLHDGQRSAWGSDRAAAGGARRSASFDMPGHGRSDDWQPQPDAPTNTPITPRSRVWRRR